MGMMTIIIIIIFPSFSLSYMESSSLFLLLYIQHAAPPPMQGVEKEFKVCGKGKPLEGTSKVQWQRAKHVKGIFPCSRIRWSVWEQLAEIPKFGARIRILGQEDSRRQGEASGLLFHL